MPQLLNGRFSSLMLLVWGFVPDESGECWGESNTEDSAWSSCCLTVVDTCSFDSCVSFCLLTLASCCCSCLLIISEMVSIRNNWKVGLSTSFVILQNDVFPFTITQEGHSSILQAHNDASTDYYYNSGFLKWVGNTWYGNSRYTVPRHNIELVMIDFILSI